MTLDPDQPTWACHDCGRKYGYGVARGASQMSAYHRGRCSVCGRTTGVTEARDYGYLKPAWEQEPFAERDR